MGGQGAGPERGEESVGGEARVRRRRAAANDNDAATTTGAGEPEVGPQQPQLVHSHGASEGGADAQSFVLTPDGMWMCCFLATRATERGRLDEVSARRVRVPSTYVVQVTTHEPTTRTRHLYHTCAATQRCIDFWRPRSGHASAAAVLHIARVAWCLPLPMTRITVSPMDGAVRARPRAQECHHHHHHSHLHPLPPQHHHRQYQYVPLPLPRAHGRRESAPGPISATSGAHSRLTMPD